jgi:tRNA A37 threonylcarbamoyladenosine dehydratase
MDNLSHGDDPDPITRIGGGILSYDDDEDDDDDIDGERDEAQKTDDGLFIDQDTPCAVSVEGDVECDDDDDLDWFRFASVDQLYSNQLSSSTTEGFGGAGQQQQQQEQEPQEDVLERLQLSTVAIIGVGGVGTWAAEALCRSGVGHFVLIDLDDCCVSQTTSSLTSMKSSIGSLKTSALRDRLKDIHPTAAVTLINDFVKKGDNIDCIVSKQLVPRHVDLVIDTIDDPQDRISLWKSCQKEGIRIIATGNSGGLKDPTRIRMSTLDDASITDETLIACRDCIISNNHDEQQKGKQLMENVLCVHSLEPPVKNLGQNVLGSVCFVSGTLGFIAASQAIEKLLEPRTNTCT